MSVAFQYGAFQFGAFQSVVPPPPPPPPGSTPNRKEDIGLKELFYPPVMRTIMRWLKA